MGLFIIFYALYTYRVISIASVLQTSVQPLIAKFLLRTFYFSLLIIALLGPTFGQSRKEIKALGKDIYFLVDLSQSMNSNDIAPSRLERVKYELSQLIKALPSNRMGLIVFSDEAFVQCPLTFDQNTLLLFIETLKTSLVPGGSTNFENSLQLALDKHTDTTNTSSENQAKVIVLFSDGEDFGDDMNSLLREINKQGIRLFTVGIGTTTGGKIPVGKGYKTDKDGNEVLTSLEKEPLQRMSGRSGGHYFEINEAEHNMAELLEAIQTTEGQLLDTKNIQVASNKYYYFLLAALFFIMMDVIIVSKTIQL